jgi:hypothetical protein
MTSASQFLGNRLLAALGNQKRPLLVKGCIDTYSRSNKQSLCDDERNPAAGLDVFYIVGEELS